MSKYTELSAAEGCRCLSPRPQHPCSPCLSFSPWVPGWAHGGLGAGPCRREGDHERFPVCSCLHSNNRGKSSVRVRRTGPCPCRQPRAQRERGVRDCRGRDAPRWDARDG